MKKTTQSIILVLCMVLSLIYVHTEPEYADAAAKPKLSKSTVKFDDIGDYKFVKIKNVKAKNIKSIIRSSKNTKVAGVEKGSSKTQFIVTADGAGETTITITLKLKKAIKKKKKYVLTLKVIVKGETVTPTPTIDPSATPEPTPTVTPTAKPGDPLTGEEKTTYDKIIARKAYYPQNQTWSNSTKYAWYAYHYNGKPKSATGTPITLDWSGSAALCAKISDDVFGAGSATSTTVPNPGKLINNPDPSVVRVGDIIEYSVPNGLCVSMVIGKNSDQFLIVESNYKETINWEAFIPKSTKINVLYSRYQTTAPSPSPTVSPSASPSASASASPVSQTASQEEIEAYTKMIDWRQRIPQGTPWTEASNRYVWSSAFNNVPRDVGGAQAFVAILSDAAFNQDVTKPVRQIDKPASNTILIGDIICFNNKTRLAMVIGRDDKNLTVAEANRAGLEKVEWENTVSLSTTIDYIWRRWPAS